MGNSQQRNGFGRLAAALVLVVPALLAVGVLAAPVAAADPSPAPAGSSQLITVNSPTSTSTTATVTAWQRGADGLWRVAIAPMSARVGGAGIGHATEGSDRTPAGTFALTQAFGRQIDPGTKMPYFRTDALDWWDENPASPTYNLHVRRSSSPGAASENLYYSGSVYDYVVNMNYNTARVPGAGSAFFLHVTDGTPTAGCVAVARSGMVAILRWLNPAAHPYISIKVGAAWKPPAPTAPVGGLNTYQPLASHRIAVQGWAFDPGAPASAKVKVTVSGPAGTSSSTGRTGMSRPDVAKTFSWAGPRSGYRIGVNAEGLGQNLVCVDVIPARTPTKPQRIGCHQVLIQNDFGRLDTIGAQGVAITVVGWALNPSSKGSHVPIRISDTATVSQALGDPRAALDRPDVAAAYPTYGPNHGYRITFRARSKGTHTVCTTALPELGSWSAVRLGCRSVVVR